MNMGNGEELNTKVLRAAGLKLMRENDKPLAHQHGLIYSMRDGATVRMKTNRGRVLMAKAREPTPNAQLSIEGTDWLLIVMPKIKLTAGEIEAYLVCTTKVVETVRNSHRAWLDSDPNTGGQNKTWVIWFDEKKNASIPEGHGYAVKWACHRL